MHAQNSCIAGWGEATRKGPFISSAHSLGIALSIINRTLQCSHLVCESKPTCLLFPARRAAEWGNCERDGDVGSPPTIPPLHTYTMVLAGARVGAACARRATGSMAAAVAFLMKVRARSGLLSRRMMSSPAPGLSGGGGSLLAPTSMCWATRVRYICTSCLSLLASSIWCLRPS